MTSERSMKARARGKQLRKARSSDLEPIEALLASRLGQIDPRLAAGITVDCAAVNPELTGEQLLTVLGILLARGVPPHIKNPAGWIRRQAAEAVRKEYLALLDRRGAAMQAAAGRPKQ